MGRPAARGPACPGRYTAGSAPGAGQTDGCAVSAALADALFGSRAVVGLELTVEGQPRRITGVFVSEEPALLCPAAQEDPAAGATAAYLAGVAANDPRGTVQGGCCRPPAWAGADPLLLPYGTLRWVLGVARHAAAAGGRGAAAGRNLAPPAPPPGPALGRGVQPGARPPRRRCRRFWPRCRAGCVPSRWADFDFWGGLTATAAETLQSLFFLPRTVCDAAPARPAAGSRRVFGGRGCGVLAGCRRRDCRSTRGAKAAPTK